MDDHLCYYNHISEYKEISSTSPPKCTIKAPILLVGKQPRLRTPSGITAPPTGLFQGNYTFEETLL